MIYGGLNSTPILCKGKFQSGIYGHWNLIFHLTENYYTELEQSKQYIPDSKIPELVVGWMMYIFVMAVLTIFNDRLIGWIAASIYFFYKRKKIKEENYYYK